MDVKKELARAIVTDFHSREAAGRAQEEFERVFSQRDLPSELPVVEVAVAEGTILLSKVLVAAGLASSNSEARRLLAQGAVKLDGRSATDPKAEVRAGDGGSLLLQVGKRRFAKVVLTTR